MTESENPDRRPPVGLDLGGSAASAHGSSAAATQVLPAITLPTGGGAIRGIGEKFAANPVTGTGTMTVPVATSPGRSAFGPQLTLNYDSGSGNGPFGFGWTVPAPAIRRKTDKGVPRYRPGGEGDVFQLTGVDDLVPTRGQPPKDVTWGGQTYTRTRMRPRTESSYSRIELWTNVADATDSHWRIVSRDNVTQWFGLDHESRIADPEVASRTYAWLLTAMHDDKGNVVLFGYKPEDSAGVELSAAHERNRTPSSRSANRYLKRIRYGNRKPWYWQLESTRRHPLPDEWLFEVVFDFGDHDGDMPTPEETSAWTVRPDPFSTYRAGFEVRAYRRCRRILMFHHFPDVESIGMDCLVRSTDLAYADEQDSAADHPTGYSFLSSVTSTGYIREEGSYRSKSLPPLELAYSFPRVDEEIRELDPLDGVGLLESAGSSRYRFVDLEGDGIAGVLSEQAGTWFYARNLSPGRAGGGAAFAPAGPTGALPSIASLASGQLLADIDRNGRPELVELIGPLPGFQTRDSNDGWGAFTPFEELPNIDWNDPSVRLVDLTGDGLPDVLIASDDNIVWHPSLGINGFGAAARVAAALDEEHGPRVVFTNSSELVALADMSGDGMIDIVRIRADEIAYWTNRGYGTFGPKVTMDHPPTLGTPEEFDPRRVLLADVDGSGTADLIHLSATGVSLYFNRSGNAWSSARPISTMPVVTDPATVTAADLLGTGTACLVLTSVLPADSDRPLRYVNLMADGKPHLLTSVVNNLGGETRLQYASSTSFAQADRLSGRPWITRLPFPVHVLERSQLLDHVMGTRLVTRYAYHHGAYDGVEREFRGFAMVETHDTDVFDEDAVASTGQDLSSEHYQPPVTTYTWFHTGERAPDGGFGHPLAHEYHDNRQFLDDPVLPANLAADEVGQCLRALRGAPLHQEVYSFDGSNRQDEPYSIAEHRYKVRRLQAREGDRPGVFTVDGLEMMNIHVERDSTDPRIAHSVSIELDELGQPVKTASVTYGRARDDASLPVEVRKAQRALTITYAEVDYTPDIDDDVDVMRPAYRLRAPYEKRAYEITGVSTDAARFTLDELRTAIGATSPIDYAAVADGTARRRLVARHRTLFRDDSLAPLALGRWDTLGLSYESYALAHTPGTLAAYPPDTVTATDLTAAGFVELDGDGSWWAPTGTVVFDSSPADHFYVVRGAIDPLGLETKQTLDQFDLLAERVEVVQAPWNVTVAINDYRVLGPVHKIDANENRHVVVLNELGLPVAHVTMGKQGATEGDTIEDPTVRFEYDLDAWRLNGAPSSVHILVREEHKNPQTRWLERYVYADGSGGIALSKLKVGPGQAVLLNQDGTTIEAEVDQRWLVSARTVVNNKGLPIRRYDPYFSASSAYEDEDTIRKQGVSAVQYYDPAGRLVLTEFPEGTTTRMVYESWRQQAFDANDTVLESAWYADRGSPDPKVDPEPANAEQRAAWLTAMHADTPATVHYDPQGRAIYAVSDYGDGKTGATRMEADYGGRFTTTFDQLGRAVAGGFTGPAGPIYGDSGEKGRRYVLADVLGAPLRIWDEYGRSLRAEYDELHRPVNILARESGDAAEVVYGHVVYGDVHPQGKARNLLGTPHLVFDQAGLIRIPSLDFEGNPASVERELATIYDAALDWKAVAATSSVAEAEAAAATLLETSAVYTVSATVNALQRPTRVTLPDGTELVSTYDEGGALAALDVQPGGVGPQLHMLVGQQYDGFGRRKLAQYGNGLETAYEYDRLTDRMTRITTAAKGADAATQALQRLVYTYDPVGNVVSLDDAAQQTFFFKNAMVTPERRYRYDAVYQLVEAIGREHAGIPNDAILMGLDVGVAADLPDAGDSSSVRRFTESYDYDLVGNITELRHRYQAQGGAGSGWTRSYHYAYEDDPNDATNRLIATGPPGGPPMATYEYDVYGNIKKLAGLPALDWNALDQLRSIDLGAGGRAYYVYGVGGQRVRRIVERPGLTIEEIQLGAFEVRRERIGNAAPRLEHRVVHVADDGGPIARIETKTIDTQGAEPANAIGDHVVSFRYGNGTGSVTLLTDDRGAPISYEEYHPWGTTAYRSAKPGVNLSLKPYRFSGKHRDEETGSLPLRRALLRAVARSLDQYRPGGHGQRPKPLPLLLERPDRSQRRKRHGGQASQSARRGELGGPVLGVLEGRKPAGRRGSKGELRSVDLASPPDRKFTPGSVSVDWSTMKGPRGPTFNANWLDGNGKQLVPREGEFGYVAPMKDQAKAEYADPVTRKGRLSENEHGTPGAHSRAVEPGYGDKEYRNDPTVRNPRNVALDKTRGDNARSAQIKAQVANSEPIDVTKMDLESNEGFHQANERARAAGEPHIENPGSINRGTLGQIGARWERGKSQTLSGGAVIEDPDIKPVTNAASTPTITVQQGPPPTGSGGSLTFAAAATNNGGNFALAATRSFVPGVAEAELAFTAAALYAGYYSAITASTSSTLSTALASTAAGLETAAAYTPVVGGSLVAGAVGGNVAESVAANYTSNKGVQLAAGVIGAAATGAAVGALIGSVVPIAGTVIGAGAGAAVGAVAGLAGYLISKFW